jgi:hypothetical protein
MYAQEFERDAKSLDRRWPRLPFNASKPASFTFGNLMRTLIMEAKTSPLKKGEGLDFCHAVLASSYSTFATLDKHWKRRVENLPKPNRLARIYSAPELDQMVTDIESFLAHRAAHAG